MSNLYFIIGSAIIGIFFTMAGIIGLMIPLDPATRTLVVQFIFENSLAIVLFGFGFLIIGFTILINLFLSFKKRYYNIRSGIKSIDIEETILQDYLNSYWEETFPSYEIPNRLTMKRNKIHIFADLPYVPKPQQKGILENIRNDLSELFAKVFGYRQDFYLSISFQKETKNHSANPVKE